MQNNEYGGAPQAPQNHEYQQQTNPYGQAPQNPVPMTGKTPSLLLTGMKALYVIVGVFLGFIAFVVAYVANRKNSDAETLECVKYALIGNCVGLVLGLILATLLIIGIMMLVITSNAAF